MRVRHRCIGFASLCRQSVCLAWPWAWPVLAGFGFAILAGRHESLYSFYANISRCHIDGGTPIYLRSYIHHVILTGLFFITVCSKTYHLCAQNIRAEKC